MTRSETTTTDSHQPVRTWATIAVAVLVLFAAQPLFAQQNKCYPGLDCPDDIPGGGNNPPPAYNPAPAPAPAPAPQPQYSQDCSNPYKDLVGLMMGAATGPSCTRRATHCCFADGTYIPLNVPESINYGDYCVGTMTMYGTVVPVAEGLGCRR